MEIFPNSEEVELIIVTKSISLLLDVSHQPPQNCSHQIIIKGYMYIFLSDDG